MMADEAAFKRLSEMVPLTADANDQECENEYESSERISTQKKMTPIEASSPTRNMPCMNSDVSRNPLGRMGRPTDHNTY